MIRVLYIRRHHKITSPWSRLTHRLPDMNFDDQDGFFRASLHSTCKVREAPLPALRHATADIPRRYDWIVVNFKCPPSGEGLTYQDIQHISAIKGCGKALFINNARATRLPPDEVLDLFDIVFKREPLKDLDRYDISASNRAKLRQTMLCCPLVPASRWNLRRIQVRDYGFDQVSRDFEHDAFFAGADTNPLRRDVVLRMKDSDLAFTGGLQARSGGAPLDWEGPAEARLSLRDYTRRVRTTRVNIALEGIGEFTYRHLELWCLCSFMISTPSIRTVQPPIRIEEGVHYVCFDDYDDLVAKVRFYRDHADERERIAMAGRQRFLEDYNFSKHGKYIERCLSGA